MSSRLRLFIVAAFIIVIVVVVIVFVALPGNTPPASGGTPGAQVRNNVTDTPLPPTTTPVPVVNLVISIQALPRGFRIPPNAVTCRQWPEESAPQLGIEVRPQEGESDIEACQRVIREDVADRIARTDIFREQPILSNMLVEDLTGLASVGSDAAAILPNNRVAIAIPMDRITSVAYAIQPGDSVDVMVSLLFVDVDLTFQTIEPNNIIQFTEDPDTGLIQLAEPVPGRVDTRPRLGEVIISPSEGQRPRMVTQRTVQRAQVIWVGDFPFDGRIFSKAATPTPVPVESEDGETKAKATAAGPTPVPPRPDIITLAVSPQDAVVLTWFMEAQLPITFALRSADNQSLAPTVPVDLQYIRETFRIDVPDKFEYSIEPAIDSIRQTFVGSRIALKRS